MCETILYFMLGAITDVEEIRASGDRRIIEVAFQASGSTRVDTLNAARSAIDTWFGAMGTKVLQNEEEAWVGWNRDDFGKHGRNGQTLLSV